MTSVTSKTKLFVLDPLWDKLTTQTQKRSLSKAGYELHVYTEPKPIKNIAELFKGQEPRVLAINPDFVSGKLKNEDYENIPNLKGIFTETTGFSWIESEAAKKLNIPISNIVDFSTQAVAEWAILMTLALARQIPRLIKDGFPLDYKEDFMKYRGIELKGKTAGIIGLGNIGLAIAERCKGLGMKVIYYSRSPKFNEYEAVELEELLKTADVIFPALAKNETTVKLINRHLIQQIKPSAIIVDITEGILSREQALAMVSSGKLYGYGFEGKPKEFLSYKGNIWTAPAYAWTTNDSMYNCEVKLIENLTEAKKGNYPNRVN